MSKSTTSKNSLLLVVLSFAAVYIIWGATYLFVAVTVESIPPYLMSAIRYGSAALMLFMLAGLLKKYQSISPEQLKNAVFAGFLFVGCGTGGVAWALQFVDSGFTALIISGEPLIVVLMMWAVDQQKPANQSFVGVFGTNWLRYNLLWLFVLCLRGCFLLMLVLNGLEIY